MTKAVCFSTGCLRLTRFEAIRHYVGVAKKRSMSEEELARLASVRRPFEKRAVVADDEPGLSRRRWHD